MSGDATDADRRRLGGQHLVKEPTELDGTRRYSCDTRNPLRAAKVLVSELPLLP